VRVLLFTGKGGVGKTTTAAATAVAAARTGARVLVVSTDPAHSLGDAFGIDLGDQPGRVEGSLWGQQLDATARMEESWADIQDWLREVFAWAGLEAIEAEELSVLPGLDEVFALADIKTHAASGDWDVLVVDCAPTAETIRLLSLPDVLTWYMERVFPVGRKVNRVVAPLLGRLTSLPVAGDEVFGATSRFYDRMDGVKQLLTDPDVTSVRLVVNPERMVIAEARRTATYLSLYGYHVDAVVANRLLPDDVVDPWFDRWRDLQAGHLKTIEQGFAPVPVLRAELADDELVGIEALAAFAERLYGGDDPAARRHLAEPMYVEEDGDGVDLVLELAQADRDDLEVGRVGDELLVRVGPYRRAIVLPDSLRRREVTGATLRDGVLRVAFNDGERRTR
jgi:arsenite/tail-anchored protein-transporting ATPase